MPLFKAHIGEVLPYRTHFREADVIFTAKDIDEAELIANDIAFKLSKKADVSEVYQLTGRSAPR